jgi:hypothetical protein
MGWTTLISNFFSSIANVFGFAGKRSDAKNTATMVKAAEAKAESAADDATSKAISNKDLDEIRKEQAE